MREIKKKKSKVYKCQDILMERKTLREYTYSNVTRRKFK